MKKYLSVIVVFFINLILPAQTKNDTIELKKVEIISKPIVIENSLVRTKIDSIALMSTKTGSLAELLSNNTPVFIKTYGQGSLATASFRGTSASHTQVLWNGLNVNNPMTGQVDFSLFPVYFIDNIDIYHGGSSLQGGSGALGGSINLSNLPDWGKKIYGSAILTAGSFDTYQAFVKIGGGSKNIHARGRFFYERSDNDFKFYNTANGKWNYMRQTNADYFKYGGLAELFYIAPKNNYLTFNGWMQIADRNLPPIMSYEGKGRKETQNDLDMRFSLNWKKYGKGFKSDFSAGYFRTVIDYYIANQTNLGSFINYDSKSGIESFLAKYIFEYGFSEKSILKAIVNYNYNKVSVFDKRDLTGYNATRNEAGFSFAYYYNPKRIISLYGLLRVDFIDNKVIPPIPSVGFEVKPVKSSDFSLKVNLTRNYHYPTLNDMYWLPGGNPNLKPEEGYSGDISAEYVFKKDSIFSFSASANGYVSYINNWIIWRPGEYRFWEADNIKKVLARGVECNMNIRYFPLKKLSFTLNANYAFTRTTNEQTGNIWDNSNSKQLIYIPLHKANVLFSAEYKKFYLIYTYSFTGERYTTSSNEVTRHSLPAYSLHGISAGKTIFLKNMSFELQLKIDNLLNKNYQAILWRAMPGRNFTVTLKFSI